MSNLGTIPVLPQALFVHFHTGKVQNLLFNEPFAGLFFEVFLDLLGQPGSVSKPVV